MGAGLSDDQTLSARLGSIIGMLRSTTRPARTSVVSATSRASFLDCASNGGSPSSNTWRACRHPVWAPPRLTLAMRLEDRFGARYRDLRLRYSHLKGWLNESPLKLALFKVFKGIQDDVFLPNSFSDHVVRDELSNGDPILFLPSQVSPQRGASAGRRCGRLLAAARPILSQRRASSWSWSLVPSQYRVYGPLVKHPRPALADDNFSTTSNASCAQRASRSSTRSGRWRRRRVTVCRPTATCTGATTRTGTPMVSRSSRARSRLGCRRCTRCGRHRHHARPATMNRGVGRFIAGHGLYPFGVTRH